MNSVERTEIDEIRRDLQNQIEDYITNYICKKYLADEYYGIVGGEFQMPRPYWRDDIIGNNPEDWLKGILAETINAGGRGEYNYWTFHLPQSRASISYLMMMVNPPLSRVGGRYDGEDLVKDYVSLWLRRNLDFLKNMILEYRLKCIENDEDEEDYEGDYEDDEEDDE